MIYCEVLKRILNKCCFFHSSFSKNPYDIKKWNDSFSATYTGLKSPLPDNLHLLTMETLQTNTIILRLENFFEKSELNEDTWINLDGLFKEFRIKLLTPMNLAANQELKDKVMWSWKTKEPKPANLNNQEPGHDRGMFILLKPMEIRTFIACLLYTSPSPRDS